MVMFRQMASEEKPPRSAVVVKTADGRRLKPECPVCGAVSWGKLVPREIDDPDQLETMILTKIAGQFQGIGVQVWACLNCGHIWHRTGAIEQKLDKKE